jgi:sugar phosphate isomerase/epimerase
MSKIFIQPDSSNFNEFLYYAKENNCNLEIASFAFANILDSNWQELLQDYKQKLEGFKGVISIHGAFQDLIYHSRDNRISEVAKERYFQNLEIAKALNAKYIVFHGNFNPLIKHESYEMNWIEQNAVLWNEAIEKYDITILIENVWEQSPEMFRRLLDKVNSTKLKICFDTGHANVFSKVLIEEWFAVLGDNLVYIHINDNKSDTDSELVPGDGNINWNGFSGLIKKYNIKPEIVFEVGSLEKSIRAIEYFRQNKIYPFD